MMHVFGMWQKAGLFGENPPLQVEKPDRDSNHLTEGRVLTSTPPSSPEEDFDIKIIYTKTNLLTC